MLTLPDRSTLGLDEESTLNLREPPAGDGSLIELIRGIIHVISRDPRLLRFTTPYANAGLEGTEFDIRVDEHERLTEVVVLEGEVVVTNSAGQIDVGRDHVAVARDGQAPTATRYDTPIERMRWASHFPSVVSGPLPGAEQLPLPQQETDPEFFARRAAARLATARIPAAEEDLAAALRLAPRNATALALKSLLALERADRATASTFAAEAVAAEPTSVTALIVRSYVEESLSDLAAAESTIRRALAAEPDNALAVTRLAEVAFARGDTRAAIESATRARDLAPAESTPLVVLGFASLRAFDVQSARAAFDAAIDLEPAAPLPRLGAALTALQADDAVEGRRQLEAAVALDPANSVARSYVAKLYAAEKRDELTATQLDLAKRFDPADATPWLYSALENLRSNRPIAAFRELQLAADKNGDRPVSRSSFALDDDVATRSAGLARVQSELGFGRLALLDAWRTTAAEPANYSGHRSLADAYSTLPRHEIVRSSELFVSQLLQPANVTPIKPQLGQQNSVFAQHAGPSFASFDELDSPVVRNGLKLRTSASRGGNNTRGEEVALAGLHERFSYGAGYYRFATDGFRDNNDVDQRVTNGFLQYNPSAATSLQAELRAVRSAIGDPTIRFDPNQYSRFARGEERADSLRLGARQHLGRDHTLLGSLIVQDSTASIHGGPVRFDLRQKSRSLEVQDIYSVRLVKVQSGISVANLADDSEVRSSGPGLGTVLTSTTAGDRQVGLYSYAHFTPTAALTVTAGVGIDEVDAAVEADGINPKLGVIWKPTPRTTLRAAAFEALSTSLTTSAYNTQPRLEPVQVAGLAQMLAGSALFDNVSVRGLGIDHELSTQLFVGWQADVRDIRRVVTDPFLPAVVTVELTLDERAQSAYLYWTPRDDLSVSARYENARYTSTPVAFQNYWRMHTQQLPIEVRYFTRHGLTFGARASRVDQKGLFEGDALSPSDPPAVVPGQDRFWILGAFVGYRLPHRRGLLSLNADNLLDERFQFQDIDPMNPSLIPERLVSFRFTLAFD